MKSIIKFSTFLLLTVVLFYISCKKEYSCENCKEKNKAPIAVAGPDQVITLPTDSVLLDGSTSSDPDGTISSFLWIKTSGPASFTINNASSAKTVVKNLTAGTYQFELKVTDNGGLSSKDTVQITVNDPAQLNRPPIANAGADQTIILPTNAVNLDGSGSTDPDNNITSYQWTKISGPTSLTILNAGAVQTQVNNLVQGVYQFELNVTDVGGLFSKDTMEVTVNAVLVNPCSTNRPVINATLVPFGTLSIERSSMTIATAGNKILFAGGDDMSNGGDGLTRVDIYDTVTHAWSTAELSISRWNMVAVTLGNKIFFAGGHTNNQNSWDLFANVDIYDASTNSWSIAQLSERRMDLAIATVGNKILFAGGVGGGSYPTFASNKVDIWDELSNTWSTATLSQARSCMSAVTAGNKIYFVGGNNMVVPGGINSCNASGVIDIYDNTTGSWSVSSTNEALALRAGINVGDKIFWAGGETKSCVSPYSTNLSSGVEIRDINTQTSTFDCLSRPNSWPGDRHGSQQTTTALINNKIVFFTSESSSDKFDIYDLTTNTWSVGLLNFGLSSYSSYPAIISINNTIYVAEGNQVWKLEF